jgi:hypothetical protein
VVFQSKRGEDEDILFATFDGMSWTVTNITENTVNEYHFCTIQVNICFVILSPVLYKG